MPLYSKVIPSGSTNGRPIPAAAVASPGTIIHTVGPTGTSDREEFEILVTNTATDDRLVTIEFGSTTTGDHIVAIITTEGGPERIIPGLSLTATTSIVRAFATATGGINILCGIDRVT